MLIAGEYGRRGLGAPAGQAGITVGGVAHEREPVGNRRGRNPELLADSGLVAHLARAAIELDDSMTPHALRQVLVRGADDHLVDAPVGRGHECRSRQCIVGLELDHGPDNHAERAQRVFQRPELGVEQRVHALARLVPGPERVAERFDDVVSRHAKMRGAVFEHSEHRPDDPADRPQLLGRVPLEGRRGREEVAEELVRSVDQVNDHEGNHTAGRPAKKHRTTFRPDRLTIRSVRTREKRGKP